jgi:hypothetical protein
MLSPLQEVLVPRGRPANEDGSTSTAVVTRGGKITAYFTGRVIILAATISFSLATAIVIYRNPGHHVDGLAGVLSTLGLGLIAWALATVVVLLAVGAILYRVLPRRRAR